MKIIDENSPTSAPKPAMFLHGLTGHGKSTWATTGGRPLVILTEAKAQSVLRQINPQAVGIVPESLDDLDALMVLLGQPERLLKQRIDRIVLDSYTELTLAIPRWLKAKAGPVGTLVKLELSEFGSLGDYALAVVKAAQLTGYPCIIIGRSISKRVGLVESVRPDGMGKSIEQLPGKLLPTAEARFDQELGYVIDTTPADHSQRCGLPWVPPIWTGSCLDYLQIIEAGPQPLTITTTATATATQGTVTPAAKVDKAPEQSPASSVGAPQAQGTPVPSSPAAPMPGSDDPVWVDLMAQLATVTTARPLEVRKALVASWSESYTRNKDKATADLSEFIAATQRLQALGTAPDPEQDPEGYKKAFADVCTSLQAEKRAKPGTVSQATNDFVDGMADGPTAGASSINPPASMAAWQNALVAFNNATFKANLPAEERHRLHMEWDAKGPAALEDLRAATLKVQQAQDAPASPRAKAEDITELTDLCNQHKVDLKAFWSYCQVKGDGKPTPDGSPNWLSLSEAFVTRTLLNMKDAEKRRAFIPWLHANHSVHV